jgi:hypothetical protein
VRKLAVCPGMAVAFVIAWFSGHARADDALDSFSVKVTIAESLRKDLECIKKTTDEGSKLTAWSDFIDAESLAVRDAIVLIKLQRPVIGDAKPKKADRTRVLIKDNGDWVPRIVLLAPGQRIDFESKRENSLYRLALPSRAAPGMR